jgi:hypothetical protein
MAEMQDMVTAAIQSYTKKFGSQTDPGALVILAIAEDLAAHVIDELGLKQEWGVGTYQKRHGKESLDDILLEDSDRSRALRNVKKVQQTDRAQLDGGEVDFRRALVTYIFREWTEEEPEAELDPELVELVESDL